MWWVLILEACGAGLILIFIVWWTMFAGNKPRPPERQYKSEHNEITQIASENQPESGNQEQK